MGIIDLLIVCAVILAAVIGLFSWVICLVRKYEQEMDEFKPQSGIARFGWDGRDYARDGGPTLTGRYWKSFLKTGMD